MRLVSASRRRVSPLFFTHGDPCVDDAPTVGNEFLTSFEKPRPVNDPLYLDLAPFERSNPTSTLEGKKSFPAKKQWRRRRKIRFPGKKGGEEKSKRSRIDSHSFICLTRRVILVNFGHEL